MMATHVTRVSQREAGTPHGFPALSKLSHIVHTFWRGTKVYSPGDPTTHLYSIISGRVKILRASASGQQKIISIRYRGDLFGESALASGAVEARRSDEAVALDTTSVAVFRVEDLWRVMRNDPAAARDALGYLTARLDEAHRQIESLVFDDNSRRLMRALFDLSGKASRVGEASVRLTHEEIAELIGSSREAITLLMLDLRRRGLIEYKRGEVRPCLPKLARFLEEEGQHGERF